VILLGVCCVSFLIESHFGLISSIPGAIAGGRSCQDHPIMALEFHRHRTTFVTTG
jgi:hypothetical protein